MKNSHGRPRGMFPRFRRDAAPTERLSDKQAEFLFNAIQKRKLPIHDVLIRTSGDNVRFILNDERLELTEFERLEWYRLTLEALVSIRTGHDKILHPSGFLIDLCLPPGRAEDVLYNIIGRYDHWVVKHGARRARLIYISQSAGAILQFWIDWVLKRAQLLLRYRGS